MLYENMYRIASSSIAKMKTAVFLVGLLFLGLVFADEAAIDSEFDQSIDKRGCIATGSFCTLSKGCCTKNCGWNFKCNPPNQK
ncbi:nemertide alpha-1 [Lineus longissimus]|uniref:nemertide alpha-1 n=1 Tax=Lineus longissimus TaxID=88925 RepID=UPI00315CE6EC